MTKKQKKETQKINYAFFDLETDPFAFPGEHDPLQSDHLDISPFAAGCAYADDSRPYFVAWGDDCIERFMAEVDANETPTIYYAHNGGKFDMRWILEYLPAQKFLEINGRLVKAKYGIHEFRDSFSLYATKLENLGAKVTIDYSIMTRSKREANKQEILDYLWSDCDVLRFAIMQLIEKTGFSRNKFGETANTAASIAFDELVKCHKEAYENCTPMISGIVTPYADFRIPTNKSAEEKEQIKRRKREHDAMFRPYYFGGVTRAFKAGVFEGHFTQVDAKSMYPSAMKLFVHPIGDKKGDDYTVLDSSEFKLDANFDIVGYPGHVYAVQFVGETVGILAEYRDGVNTLDFRRDLNHMISHEFREAMKLGMVTVEKVVSLVVFNLNRCADFSPFTDKFFDLRLKAKNERDKFKDDKSSPEWKLHESHQIYYKTLLASAYGKFAQYYKNFKDTYWRPEGCNDDLGGDGDWESIIKNVPDEYEGSKQVSIGQKKQKPVSQAAENYYNVLVAASITSAARALLMRKTAQIAASGAEIYYCDTDSVLFSGKPSKEIASNEEKLGEWGVDLANIYKVAIAGAKTYALYYEDSGKKQKPNKKTGKLETLVKSRSKGAIVPHDEIVRLAADPERIYTYVSLPPGMTLHNPLAELVRDIKFTAKPVPYATIETMRMQGVSPRQLVNADGVRYTEAEIIAMETPEMKAKRFANREIQKEKARLRKGKKEVRIKR